MRSVYLILMTIFFSCETTIDPQLPDNGPGIVMYSFFRPGVPLKIDAFNTVPVLQTETIQRNRDLSVRFLENGEFVEEVVANPQGIYVSSIVPAEGKTYSFETTNGAEIISAKSYIPHAVKVTKVLLSEGIEFINSGKYGYPAQISLADPLETLNFYALEVRVENCSSGCTDDNLKGSLNEVLVEELRVNTSGNSDIEILGGPQQIDGLKYIYFSDEGFNGETVTLKFFIIPTLLDLSSDQNVKFILKSITKEYYEYLRTSDFQKELEEEGNLSEPVQITTNIQNGLGTFAGYNYSIYTIKH